jgi:hypothetical protein
MTDVLIILAIVIPVVIMVLLAFIATRPENFRIERSAEVRAPADVIFALINDFREWPRWSPYEKLDPNMKKTFEGPATGPGSVYIWSGNNKAGEGRATILESKPGELVSIKLDFVRPFAATCYANFALTPSQAGTRVTWSMDGKNNFMAKAFSLVMNMDKMVGKDFEEGLANLNTAAQAETQKVRQA